jgi:hypothetical protein
LVAGCAVGVVVTGGFAGMGLPPAVGRGPVTAALGADAAALAEALGSGAAGSPLGVTMAPVALGGTASGAAVAGSAAAAVSWPAPSPGGSGARPSVNHSAVPPAAMTARAAPAMIGARDGAGRGDSLFQALSVAEATGVSATWACDRPCELESDVPGRRSRRPMRSSTSSVSLPGARCAISAASSATSL